MSTTVKSESSASTAPVYLVPVTGVVTENAQPAPASGNGAQTSSVMYQMVYPSGTQPGTQPVMTVVTYPPQQYGPVKPIPDEISDDLYFIMSWRSFMITMLVFNFIISIFIAENSLITNVIGAVYFCEYCGWLTVVYAVGNALSVITSAYVAFSMFYAGSELRDRSYTLAGVFYILITVFFVIILVYSIVYCVKAMKVSNDYTDIQIRNVAKSEAWRESRSS